MLSQLSQSASARISGSSDPRTSFPHPPARSLTRTHARSPTALDALVFAYLHCILHSKEHALRFEVTRRVNLVAWERRVQSQVRGAFRARPSVHA